jgi:hypothetical protein
VESVRAEIYGIDEYLLKDLELLGGAVHLRLLPDSKGDTGSLWTGLSCANRGSPSSYVSTMDQPHHPVS